jgi:hypothetical protein
MLINGIVLTTSDRIEKDFGGFLNTLEETVVFSTTGSCLLVGMVTEYFLAMSTLNLLFGRFVAMF